MLHLTENLPVCVEKRNQDEDDAVSSLAARLMNGTVCTVVIYAAEDYDSMQVPRKYIFDTLFHQRR